MLADFVCGRLFLNGVFLGNFGRSLFWPRLGVRTQGSGVGYTDFGYDRVGNLFKQCMCTMFALVRCYDQMPVDWVSAQACPLDKKNSKVGCEAVRLGNIVEEMGNSYVGHLLQSGAQGRSKRAYASSYQTRRSRLEAVIQQRVVAYRARQAGLNFAVSSKDVKNAFASPGHDQQDDGLRARLRPQDLRLCQQSYRNARVVLNCADGELVVKPGCGALQGTMAAVDIFQDVYHPAVDEWMAALTSPRLVVRDPLFQEDLDLSLTSYADDVAKGKLFTHGEDLLQQVQAEDRGLSDALQRICTAQNVDKQEHTVSMRGRGAWTEMQRVYQPGFLTGQVAASIKYLGCWLHHEGRQAAEITYRIKMAKNGMVSVGWILVQDWYLSSCSYHALQGSYCQHAL